MKQIDPTIVHNIRVIIGLGNPGVSYYYQRHNIGFRIIDALAQQYHVQWYTKNQVEQTEIVIDENIIMLIKPQTFMNASGLIIPGLLKKGIKPEQILVIHDELELPFGTIKVRVGGSHRGHNGLKSIIAVCGPDFVRLRFGVGRPENRDEVPHYVLKPFSESKEEVERLIEQALEVIVQIIKSREA